MYKRSVGDHLKRDTVLPDNVDELIELINKLYPNRSPGPQESFQDLMYRGGQRSVVDFLIELKNRSEM
tara:strand:+ start:6753 stop:6956 length:204 start_codon:yes stop_codon:yes gene_type:complete